MLKFLYLAICVCLFLAGNTPATAKPAQLENTTVTELEVRAKMLPEVLNTSRYDEALALMSADVRKALDGKLADLWQNLTDNLGGFRHSGPCVLDKVQGYIIGDTQLVFNDGTITQRTVFDNDKLIAGLSFLNLRKGVPENTGALPAGVKETPFTVDAGDGYPLEGLVTMPTEGRPKAAVVLVQGSGPSDKDEAVGANRPFADLAQGLAQRDIAVLRYDKRTYVYGKEIAASPDFARFSIDEETARDAAAAVRLLKQAGLVDPGQIYLLGHSMGGGLLAYLDRMEADSAGYILLAASPRKMWELSAEQNLTLADEFEQGGDSATATAIRALVAENLQKALNLSNLPESEAQQPGNAIFGINAYYFRHQQDIDPVALHLADGKPILIIQGGRDRQATMTDYELWRAGLAAHPAVSYRLYPQLNHLMGDYDGPEVPFAQMLELEYGQYTPVDTQVIEDIAAWILQRD